MRSRTMQNMSFIRNVEKISGPKRSIKITDHFTCTSANVIYCITCTLCKTLYIGETGRRRGDRFREHLRDLEKDHQNASKPVAWHFNLTNHFKQIWQSAAFPFPKSTKEARKAANLFFKSALLGSVHMEVGDLKVGEVLRPGGVTNLSIQSFFFS